MQVTKDMLLRALPPNREQWIVIRNKQQVSDIIEEMLEGYPLNEKFYDKIGMFFQGATLAETCDNLYDCCKRYLEYREESEDWQTHAPPQGLLDRGYCDCKGYASFVGGCLGAIARATGDPIDWSFYFASYDPKVRTPYHVFVTVTGADGEIWIDPTPGADGMEPVYQIIEKPEGLQSMAGVDASGRLVYGMGATSVPVPISTGNPEIDAAIRIGQQYQAFIEGYVNKSGLKDTVVGQWISTGGNPIQILQLIGTWISGRQFTGGDYALGEIFLNRVMQQQTNSRWDTPDKIVPAAWNYFTTLLGIPVAVNTDLEHLSLSDRLEDYLQGRPEQAGKVTREQVKRAYQLIQILGHEKYSDWGARAWGLLPYVAPIPQPHGVGLYTGQLPDGENVVNGIVQTPGVMADSSGGTTSNSLIGNICLLAGLGFAAWWWFDN